MGSISEPIFLDTTEIGIKFMSMKTLESAILRSARYLFNNPKLRMKDIQEWSTGNIKPQSDEVTEFIPDPGVFITVYKIHDKRKK